MYSLLLALKEPLQSRKVDRTDRRRVSEANKYFFVEASIALFASFIINTFVVGVFADGLFGKTNKDVVSRCSSVKRHISTTVRALSTERFRQSYLSQ